ncbi:hypothetical protein [Cytobacillus praedii]|uniref:hypothetical protein n=1 Tax=Cytobacillus praedii TaxID=1742358 RepID=UPI002E2358A6|nr:hypothetical protein [Cytobacillus praedii]
MKFQPKTDWKYDDTPTEGDFNRIEQGIDEALKRGEVNNEGLVVVEQLIGTHCADRTNPHNVTTSQINKIEKNSNNNISPLSNFSEGITIMESDLMENGFPFQWGTLTTHRVLEYGWQLFSKDNNILYTRTWNPDTKAWQNWSQIETTTGAQSKANKAELNAKDYIDQQIAGIEFDDIDREAADISYYVRTTGNDDNDGKSEATAFATLGRALREWKPITIGGKRTFNIGEGVDLSESLTPIHRELVIKNKFGGDFVFNFNSAHALNIVFENLQCKIRVENFEKYNSNILEFGMGEGCYVENCQMVDFNNVTCNLSGKESSYAAFYFSRSRGRVGEATFTSYRPWIIAADAHSFVFVWMPKGTMRDNTEIPYRASGGAIIDVLGNQVTNATVLKEEEDAGRVFGV